MDPQIEKINAMVAAAAKPAESTGTENQQQANEQGNTSTETEVEVNEKVDTPPPANEADNVAEVKTDTPPPVVEDPLAKFLQETGFKSLEEAKAVITKKDEKVKSPEEIKRDEEVYQAKLGSFAVEENLMSNSDLVKLQTVRSKPEKDLVFEKFSAEMSDVIEEELKAEKASDEDPPTKKEVEEKIREAFEKEYPLESKSEKARTRAEARIKKEASEIKAPLESSFQKAKDRYDEIVNVRNVWPEYQSTLTKLVTDSIPEKIPFYQGKNGDEVINVDVDIPAADRKEINEILLKELQSPETMAMYRNGKTEEIQALLKSKLDYLMWSRYGEKGKAEIAKRFKSLGLNNGSTTGAENRFAENQAKTSQSDKQSTVTAAQQAIDSTRKRKT